MTPFNSNSAVSPGFLEHERNLGKSPWQKFPAPQPNPYQMGKIPDWMLNLPKGQFPVNGIQPNQPNQPSPPPTPWSGSNPPGLPVAVKPPTPPGLGEGYMYPQQPPQSNMGNMPWWWQNQGQQQNQFQQMPMQQTRPMMGQFWNNQNQRPLLPSWPYPQINW